MPASDEFLYLLRKNSELARELVLVSHTIESFAMKSTDRDGCSPLPSEVLLQMLESAPTLLVELDGEDDPLILKAGHLLEEILGYFRGELEWKPLSTVIPDDKREAHRKHIQGFKIAPRDRPMGAGIALLEARRKDGSLVPVTVYLKTFGCQGKLYTNATVIPVEQKP